MVVVRFAELAAPAEVVPVAVAGFAAVPAPVPVVVDGTQVTGAAPVGLALPIALPVALGAGVMPPGVCVTG